MTVVGRCPSNMADMYMLYRPYIAHSGSLCRYVHVASTLHCSLREVYADMHMLHRPYIAHSGRSMQCTDEVLTPSQVVASDKHLTSYVKSKPLLYNTRTLEAPRGLSGIFTQKAFLSSLIR